MLSLAPLRVCDCTPGFCVAAVHVCILHTCLCNPHVGCNTMLGGLGPNARSRRCNLDKRRPSIEPTQRGRLQASFTAKDLP
jgi:hypothetical protein